MRAYVFIERPLDEEPKATGHEHFGDQQEGAVLEEHGADLKDHQRNDAAAADAGEQEAVGRHAPPVGVLGVGGACQKDALGPTLGWAREGYPTWREWKRGIGRERERGEVPMVSKTVKAL